MPDGTLLADAVASDPKGWLGPEHVAKYGSDTGLLVKLLDAGQRLPVHVHPDRSFAAEHLASPHGKTEAWVIIEASPDAGVHLGFNRDVTAAELNGWARDQDIETLLAVTNRVPVSAGDTVLCPAGTPHAISEGILLVELQEPADLSIMLEWSTFSLAEDEATLGLPLAEALSCINRRACPPERLTELRAPFATTARPARCCPPMRTRSSWPNGSMPRSATSCRRATACWCSPGAMVTWPPRTVRHCRWAGAAWSPSRTQAGPAVLSGDLEGVRCLPAGLTPGRGRITRASWVIGAGQCGVVACRAASKGSRSKMIRMEVIRPSATVTYSAPGAAGTGRVLVSYMTTAVVASPKAATTLDSVTMVVNGPMNPRKAAAPSSRPAGASQTMPGSM